MMKLGSSIKRIREGRGLTQRAAAEVLGISDVHLCNLEHGKLRPSSALLDKMFEAWGVDVYILACLHGGEPGLKRFPRALQKPVQELRRLWERMD